ncbi:MAG: tail fiber domain-containing protein, partial [Flavobacteriaceae bacterium]
TALGRRAMEFKTGGNNNTAIGTLALRANTTGNINTIVGSAAGFNVEGDGNVIIGVGRTLSGTRTISNSVFIGKYAGNPETNSDRLYIENSESATPLIYGEFDNDVLGFNADVGINTQSPSASLHVNHQNGSSTEGFVISNVIDADEWRMYMQWNSNTLSMFFNNTNVGNFDDVSGTYSAVSDRRLKKNIEPLGTVLEKVNQLEVVDYNFIHQQESKKYTGLIAQEVEVLFPNLVVPPNEESENYTMDYSAFGVIAIKAIQEQQEEIDHLKKELEQLRNFIKSWQNE